MATYITLSYPDVDGEFCKIADYDNQCIVLSTVIPVFGCGAIYARIWHAGVQDIRDINCCGDRSTIILLSELGS